MSAWLQFVCVRRRTFCYWSFLFPRILHSPFYQQGSRRCADGAERKWNEIKAKGKKVDSVNSSGQTTVNNCAPKHYITPINVMP